MISFFKHALHNNTFKRSSIIRSDALAFEYYLQIKMQEQIYLFCF